MVSFKTIGDTHKILWFLRYSSDVLMDLDWNNFLFFFWFERTWCNKFWCLCYTRKIIIEKKGGFMVVNHFIFVTVDVVVLGVDNGYIF